MSKERRADFARRVKALRQSAGMTQQDLAEAAGVTRQTIVGIETGATVPQLGVLVRVLGPLGVDIDGPRFNDQTESWLAMMGSLIEAIPTPRREPTVNSAIRVLADGIRGDNVIAFPTVGGVEQDSDKYETEDRAASKKNPARVEPTPESNEP